MRTLAYRLGDALHEVWPAMYCGGLAIGALPLFAPGRPVDRLLLPLALFFVLLAVAMFLHGPCADPALDDWLARLLVEGPADPA